MDQTTKAVNFAVGIQLVAILISNECRPTPFSGLLCIRQHESCRGRVWGFRPKSGVRGPFWGPKWGPFPSGVIPAVTFPRKQARGQFTIIIITTACTGQDTYKQTKVCMRVCTQDTVETRCSACVSSAACMREENSSVPALTSNGRGWLGGVEYMGSTDKHCCGETGVGEVKIDSKNAASPKRDEGNVGLSRSRSLTYLGTWAPRLSQLVPGPFLEWIGIDDTINIGIPGLLTKCLVAVESPCQAHHPD